MESEFIALDKAREEAEWLRHFLQDIPLWSKSVRAICIYCDNQAAIFRAQNFIYNSKSVVDIIPLSSCSQMESSLLTLSRQKII